MKSGPRGDGSRAPAVGITALDSLRGGLGH